MEVAFVVGAAVVAAGVLVARHEGLKFQDLYVERLGKRRSRSAILRDRASDPVSVFKEPFREDRLRFSELFAPLDDVPVENQRRRAVLAFWFFVASILVAVPTVEWVRAAVAGDALGPAWFGQAAFRSGALAIAAACAVRFAAYPQQPRTYKVLYVVGIFLALITYVAISLI
jgi:hypothetical protein